MKKIILFLMMMMMTACSSPSEDLGETQEAVTACSITGSTGVASRNDEWVITKVRAIYPVFAGKRLSVTACQVSTGTCTSSMHAFADVTWSDVNGHIWEGSIDYPLRRIVTGAPGCQLSEPDKYCMTLYGDNNVGSHVNLLQNVNRFLLDRPITIGTIEAPVGGAVMKIAGLGTDPINTWRMWYTNSAGTGIAVKNWAFTAPGCAP